MTPEQYRAGAVVWYEPSPGVRFRGTLVDDAPRKIGSLWVTAVAMDGPDYGVWLRSTGRMSVPAAALDCLFLEEP